MNAADIAAVGAALRADRLAEARALLDALPATDPAVAHVDAILLWREGRIAAARERFAAALRARPRDANLLADAADFEAAQGGTDAAARLFRQAIGADPAAAPPRRLRLGLALIAGGELAAAVRELEALVRDAPNSALAWQALGAARRQADDVPGAATAFDRVLALKPGDPLARLSRAQVEADRGRPAAPAYAQALAADGDSGPARTGLATAQAHERGFAAAEATLRERLGRDPGWVDGWAALASLAHRWAGSSAVIAVADEALRSAPEANAAVAALALIARAGEQGAVLARVAGVRARWGEQPPLDLIEAVALDEIGDTAAASCLLDALAHHADPAVALARLRHQLRRGQPDRAAATAQALIDAGGDGEAMAWPYLGTAWRLLGDARHQWLEGDPRLVGRYDLGLSHSELAALADRLRLLHRAPFGPFEQSMRGGTQSEGALLSREEPELRRLRQALAGAVREHIARSPPTDPAHPTLRQPRGGARFAGSWSVRLTGGGHHVSHVHSEGWFSSACHIVVPGGEGGGSLTLGEPPAELATGLAPLSTIAPVPGWLVLFPSIMWHGTTPFGAGERLSVAFDVQPLR